ncbi:hypothetical protein [Halorhodospira halochloris]|uniref:hypothetical protein n=1 Tax=Halorhodospira halochloris TaxID=1052 RepID=UPI001EE942F0|nr:hypothetical protein [Halorhodospira halochloris]MCG5547526.1 hypothetical protein [Halorhodospira halochloris]
MSTNNLAPYPGSHYEGIPLHPDITYAAAALEELHRLLSDCLSQAPRYLVLAFRPIAWCDDPKEHQDFALPYLLEQLRAGAAPGAIIRYAWSRERLNGQDYEYRIALLIPYASLSLSHRSNMLTELHYVLETAWAQVFGITIQWRPYTHIQPLPAPENEHFIGTELLASNRHWVFRWLSENLAIYNTKAQDGYPFGTDLCGPRP